MKSLLILVLLALAACAPATASIQHVTPLPADYAPPIASPSAEAPSEEAPNTVAPPTATPGVVEPSATPLANDLPQGNARDIAFATDTALVLTPAAPQTFEENPVRITFDEFYDGYNLRTGLILSQKLLSLDGQRVMMEGYMAPPLKAELDYFVLTRIRLAFCPFCSNASDWPDDIALIYMPADQPTTAVNDPVRIVGQMQVGMSVDRETGMVSLVRIYAEQLETL